MGLLKKDGKLLLIHGTGETPSIAMAKVMGRKFKFALSNMLVAKEYEHGQDWKNSQVIKDAKNDKGFFNIVIVSDGLSTTETHEAKMMAVFIQPSTRVLLTLDESALGKLCTSEADMELACGKGCPIYGVQEDTSPRRPPKIKEEILSRTPCRPLKTIPIAKPEAMSCPEIPLCGHDHHFNMFNDPDEMSKFALDDMAMAEARAASVQKHVKLLQLQQEVKEGQQHPGSEVALPPVRSPRQTPCRSPIPIMKPEAMSSCVELRPLCGRDHDAKVQNAQTPKFALDDVSMHHHDKDLVKILLPNRKW